MITELVLVWEEARAALDAHWEQKGDLDQFNTDDGGRCVGGRCMECQYDGCASDTCELYAELAEKLRAAHAAMIEAARSPVALSGKQE